MKKVYLTMLVCILCISVNGQQATANLKANSNTADASLLAQSQMGMTIVNHSGMAVYYKVAAKDIQNGQAEYSSLTQMVKPNSVTELGGGETVQWAHDATPRAYRFSSFSGSYIDPSGDCTEEATNAIGGRADKLKESASIAAGKCGNTPLTLSWSVANGHATVTISE